MKLTPKQIEQIEETLVLKDVVYEDIKLELIDHIASYTEELMISNDYSFEVAFDEALKKWDGSSEDESGTLSLPSWKSLPNLFLDKWIEESKRQSYHSVLISAVVTFSVFGITNVYRSETVLRMIERLYIIFCSATIILAVIGLLMLFNSKTTTSFGKMFKNYCVISIGVLSLALIMFIESPFLDRKSFTVFDVLTPTYFLVSSILSFRFLYKHFKFERKLKAV